MANRIKLCYNYGNEIIVVPENYKMLLDEFVDIFDEHSNKEFIFKYRDESGELKILEEKEVCPSFFYKEDMEVYVEEKKNKNDEIKVIEIHEEKEKEGEKEKKEEKKEEEKEEEEGEEEGEEREDDKDNKTNFISQLSFKDTQIKFNKKSNKEKEEEDKEEEKEEEDKEEEKNNKDIKDNKENNFASQLFFQVDERHINEEEKKNRGEEQNKILEEDEDKIENELDIDRQMEILINKNRNNSFRTREILKENLILEKKLAELKIEYFNLEGNEEQNKKINYDEELEKLKNKYNKNRVKYENEIEELNKTNKQLENQLNELQLASNSAMNIKKNKKNKKEFLNLINKNFKKEKLKREEKNEEDLDKIYESVKIEEENNRQLTIMKSNLKLNKLKEINKANKKNKNMNNQNEEKKENEELKHKKEEANEILEKLQEKKTIIEKDHKTRIIDLKKEIEKEKIRKLKLENKKKEEEEEKRKKELEKKKQEEINNIVYSYECSNLMYLQQTIYIGTDKAEIPVIMKNDGNITWPKNKTKLVFDKNSKIKGENVELGPLVNGEKQKYIVIIDNLSTLGEGIYDANVWFNVNDKNYGKMLNLRIEIKKMEEDPIKKNMETIEKFRAQFYLDNKDDFPDEVLYENLYKNDFDFEKTFGKMFE